jgi:choline dehydrogenase
MGKSILDKVITTAAGLAEILALDINTPSTGTTPKATGVGYLHGRSLYRADPFANKTDGGIAGSVQASREVIVFGGTFNTPRILKLSGVDPAAELESFGIPVIKD